jgi:hypothetical protein
MGKVVHFHGINPAYLSARDDELDTAEACESLQLPLSPYDYTRE